MWLSNFYKYRNFLVSALIRRRSQANRQPLGSATTAVHRARVLTFRTSANNWGKKPKKQNSPNPNQIASYRRGFIRFCGCTYSVIAVAEGVSVGAEEQLDERQRRGCGQIPPAEDGSGGGGAVPAPHFFTLADLIRCDGTYSAKKTPVCLVCPSVQSAGETTDYYMLKKDTF